MSLSDLNSQVKFYNACQNGDRDTVSEMLKNGRAKRLKNQGLRHACRGGQLDIVKLLIACYVSDLRSALNEANDGGHIEIVEFITQKIAEENIDMWNFRLKDACKDGDIESVKFAISNGANDWHDGLLWACFGGNMEIVQLILSHGGRDLNGGLMAAFQEGHMEIVKLMISLGANRFHDIWWSACEEGKIEMVELLISQGYSQWNIGLWQSNNNGHMDILKLMIEHGASDTTFLQKKNIVNVLNIGCAREYFLNDERLSSIITECDKEREHVKNCLSHCLNNSYSKVPIPLEVTKYCIGPYINYVF